jgi:hypothetical protein
MPITMQGSWTVSVKSKSAAFPQRFVIEGAATGNGTYPGDVAAAPVFVTGASWIVRIQNNPGTGFVDSADRIKFPAVVAGQYRFDIESDDGGGSDIDFNDLILTCSTPVTATDFLVYGNVLAYSGCLINPCIRRWIVIETADALVDALKNPVLRVPIEKLYPERIPLPPVPPGPPPDPPPFTPLVIPLAEEAAIPARRVQIVPRAPAVREVRAVESPDAEEEARSFAVRSVAVSAPARLAVDFDRVAAGRIADAIRPLCLTDPLAGYVLRFQEYDRTAAELAGGPYTGTGSRETLGACATDRNGNYIFRFSRSLAQFFGEADVDVAAGEDEVVQAMPDLIVQLLDATLPGGVAFETAPYWNVPLLKRIDLCIPRGRLRRPPTGCQEDALIYSIGNIRIHVAATTFDAAGRVTCTDVSLPDIPQARCAAWGGALRFFACFNKDLPVTQYTVRHRHRVGLGWSAWEFYQEPLPLLKITMVTEQIGPFDRMLELTSGGPLQPAKAYNNIQNNLNFAGSERELRAVVSSAGGSPPYAPAPGTVQFRIQGYDASGMQVAGAVDTVTLYIDNTIPELAIPSVTMGSQTGGDCALFSLSGEPSPARVTVRFKALQRQGFLRSYDLTVRKGNIGSFGIATTTGPGGEASAPISGSYVHGGGASCNQLFGTLFPHEPLADAGGFVTAYVVPASGNWLAPGQPFCTFAFNVGAVLRVTNGYNTAEYSYGPVQYLLGIQQ